MLLHLTVNTGHARLSPRSEVRDDVIARLRPMVRAGGGPIPGRVAGYAVTITRDGRDAVFTVSRAARPVGLGRSSTRAEGWNEDLHWLADFERCLAWALLETATA